MKEFTKHERTNVAEMRPYVKNEDLTGISVGEGVTPKEGGWIAQDPTNHNDKWYVSEKYYNENFSKQKQEIKEPTDTYIDRLNIERNELAIKLDKLTVALQENKVPPSAVDILTEQKLVMVDYLDILNKRLN